MKVAKGTLNKGKLKKRSLSDAGKVSESDGKHKSEPASVAEPFIFTITRAGKRKEYSISPGYGYFVGSFRKATNLAQISEVVERGIPSREIAPIINYLEFKVPEIAKAAAVSPSTVSRWAPDTSIGVPGSSQFFRIDEVIKKGVDLFGGLDEFKSWLNSPNMALGNATPSKIITSQIGVDLVDEALDALHFGNVM